jgi:flagellar basal-body rod protein FlgG
MLNAIYIAAVGLQAQKEQLDASANNFANMSTSAYKRQSVDFSAILDRAPSGRGVDAVTPVEAPPDRLLRVDMTPGAIQATGKALDLAIDGAGFVEVELPEGKTGYSRGGSLQVNADGGLSLANGLPLKAELRIPATAADVQVAADGTVTASLSAGAVPTLLGQIELATFGNPEALQYRGDGVFTAAEGSPDPVRTRPGVDGSSLLVPASLEGSNVAMTNEMVSLMLTERIYELNSHVVQIADEMMSMSNNLRHG